jgi:high-affinity K+ transport system ATPase subunit B
VVAFTGSLAATLGFFGISTSIGARNDLLVKDRLALERARDLDVVIFDKTGWRSYSFGSRGCQGSG